MKKYASIQNRVLVDYKKFRDSIVAQLKQLNSSYNYPATDSVSITPTKTLESQYNSTKKVPRYNPNDDDQHKQSEL